MFLVVHRVIPVWGCVYLTDIAVRVPRTEDVEEGLRGDFLGGPTVEGAPSRGGDYEHPKPRISKDKPSITGLAQAQGQAQAQAQGK